MVKYKVDENFFDKWSGDMAYILGLWYADGWAIDTKQGCQVCIELKDKCLLEQVKMRMGDVPIKELCRTINSKQVHSYLLRYCRNGLYKSLVSRGYNNKDVFPRIPGEYISYFMRGYFDGDGSLQLRENDRTLRFSIYGPKPLLTEYSGLLAKKLQLSRVAPVFKTQATHGFNYAKITDVAKIFRYLYSDNSIGLCRKCRLFGEWFETVGSKELLSKSTIQDNIRRILELIGENPNREGIKYTPHRVERLYNNLFYGYRKKLKVMNEEERNTGFDENIIPITVFKNESDEMLIRKVNAVTFCEHHIAVTPLEVWVGIIPDETLMGMNKIDKVVKYFAARLQIQERMTNQVADWISDNIEPKGVIVVIKGIHYCAELQGDSGNFITSAVRGIFLHPDANKDPKSEFLTLIKEK
ncbi:hypothetical protein LCGC14_0909650 [marine sediment metagenome]|uniref:GTP cyclohydrolase I n=1 Tax=marine sediment metagenome TaxID=412755 RepID=A0A0F9NYQ8_9ZZZZ